MAADPVRMAAAAGPVGEIMEDEGWMIFRCGGWGGLNVGIECGVTNRAEMGVCDSGG